MVYGSVSTGAWGEQWREGVAVRLLLRVKFPLTLGGGPVHDLVLDDGLTLVVLVGPRPCRLSSDDRHLHMLYLDAHKQEVDLRGSGAFRGLKKHLLVSVTGYLVCHLTLLCKCCEFLGVNLAVLHF